MGQCSEEGLDFFIFFSADGCLLPDFGSPDAASIFANIFSPKNPMGRGLIVAVGGVVGCDVNQREFQARS